MRIDLDWTGIRSDSDSIDPDPHFQTFSIEERPGRHGEGDSFRKPQKGQSNSSHTVGGGRYQEIHQMADEVVQGWDSETR